MRIENKEQTMLKKDISELVDQFTLWYQNDPHAQDEDYYKDTLTGEYLGNLSDKEFKDFVNQFLHDGGRVQTGASRTTKSIKQSIEASPEEERAFLIKPFEKNFKIEDWLQELDDSPKYNRTIATIFLNRVDKYKHPIINNRSIEALKIFGFPISGTFSEIYKQVKAAETELIEKYPLLDNFFKVDALAHFMIGTKNGKKITEQLFQVQQSTIIDLIDTYKELKKNMGHSDEFFKYQAIQHFRTHWAIDAPDFANMLKEALRKQVNLIYQDSISSLNLIANAEPEAVRSMFRHLYDEETDLRARIKAFQNQAQALIKKIKPEWQHRQEERAISVYLSFRFPEKYYIYKDSFYSKFTKMLGESKARAGLKYQHYLELITDFKKRYVMNDEELWSLTNATLPDDAWPDKSMNVLAQDILYCTLEKEHETLNNQSGNEEKLLERFKDIGQKDIIETHLNYLELLVNELGLDQNDPRLSFATRQKDGLSATINQRYIIWTRHEKEQNNNLIIGLAIMKPDLKKYKKTMGVKSSWQFHKFPGEKNPPFFRFFPPDILQDNEELIKDWFKAARYELQRASKSGFHKYHNQSYFKAIVDRGYRETMLSKAFSSRKNLAGLNIILYGPPGTGKTFSLKRDYFPTFTDENITQTKEEFLDHMLPDLPWWQVITLAMLDLKKAKVNDIAKHPFLKAKIKGSSNKTPKNTIWSWLQRHTKNDCPNVSFAVRDEPLIFWKDENATWEIDNKIVENELPELVEKLEEIKAYTPQKAIANRYEFVTFHQSYSYEDFIEGIKPVLSEDEVGQNELQYEIKDGVFKSLVKRAKKDLTRDYALFIDEINRGNVASIFGELITLVEEDKRMNNPNALEATLPYSREKFSVPPNLYIIATMNTADRSVEALDTALRRRFIFIEKSPDPQIIEQPANFSVDLHKLLETINLRIERLLNKDHCIGHSYFMNIANEENPLHALKQVFANKVIPLLEEYFYGDMSKTGSILGSGFVEKVENHIPFATDFLVDEFEEKEIHRIKNIESATEKDFISIYDTTNH